MNIHEFQAKALLARHGVPVPPRPGRRFSRRGGRDRTHSRGHRGGQGTDPRRRTRQGDLSWLRTASRSCGSTTSAATGRCGGDPGPRRPPLARRMLGNTLVTKQTGPPGGRSTAILLEEGIAIEREFYLASCWTARTLAGVHCQSRRGRHRDRRGRRRRRPEAILKVPVDPRVGYSPLDRAQDRLRPWASGRKKAVARPASSSPRCTTRSSRTTASLAEINPLILTKDGRVLALDAKMNFDDQRALPPQGLPDCATVGEEDPLEVEASEHDLNYIKLDGNRSAAWSTARAWPWRPWTSSSCTAGRRPTSSTSVAARPPRW